MDMLQQPTVQALAKALLHFLWQGAALALGLHAIVRTCRPRANVRYALGVACLATMMLAPVATTIFVQGDQPATSASMFASATLALVAPPAGESTAPTAAAWTLRGAIVCVWLAGVAILSLRLLGGWLLTRRLVGRARNLAAPEIVALARRVADRLALTRIVGIVESPTIVVPMMIGWIAPVVILPTAALVGLTPMQIEALLAHELAHVRRHDYLVNLLQSVVETLLFYHPAVWWVSRDVRESREHCCDDLAVAVCDRVVYASALADLAAIASTPRFALAATDGSLVARVRRILGGGEDVGYARGLWLPALILALLVATAMPIALVPARAQSGTNVSPAAQTQTVDVPLPQASLEASRVAAPVGTANLIDSSALAAPQQRAKELASSADLKAAADIDQVNKARQAHLQLLLLKSEYEDLISATVSGQDNEQRLVELRAAIEKLQRILDDGDLRLLKENAEAKYLDKLSPLDRTLQDRADNQVALEKQMKAIDLDKSAMLKLEDARRREVDTVLGKRWAAARTAGDESGAEGLAKMKAELESNNSVLDKKLRDFKIETDESSKAMLLFGAMGKNAADFDPKEMQAVIAPAFEAGPNDVSVVGRSVGHPGRVDWHDGLTVEAALKAAGAPPVTSAEFLVRRLSAMQVTFGAGGPHVSGRVDDVTAATMLRPGDVLIVSPRTRK